VQTRLRSERFVVSSSRFHYVPLKLPTALEFELGGRDASSRECIRLQQLSDPRLLPAAVSWQAMTGVCFGILAAEALIGESVHLFKFYRKSKNMFAVPPNLMRMCWARLVARLLGDSRWLS
jgi:hypothetical protein